MANPRLKLVVPAIEKRTVAPRRPKNSELRTREYLTAGEVEELMGAARRNRYGHRDATMVLIALSGLCALPFSGRTLSLARRAPNEGIAAARRAGPAVVLFADVLFAAMRRRRGRS